MAYIKTQRYQNYILPPNLRDLFSENHVAYLVEQITDSIDYSEFDIKYSGAGHPAYLPRIILKLLLIGNIDGIRSSRKIANSAQRDAVYIYLSEKATPDFRTISDFRKNNQDLLKQVSLELSKFALENKILDLSAIFGDGTVIEANANKYKTVDKETLDKLGKYIEDQIKEGIKVDEEEDKIYGDRGMHELPKELSCKEKRKAIVQQIANRVNEAMKKGDKEEAKKVQKEVEGIKEYMEEKGLKKFNPTDPEARLMRGKKARSEIAYNAQLVVDKNGIILADRVIQEGVDRDQIVPNVDEVENNFGKLDRGTKVIADKGYEKAKELKKLDDRGYDLYVPGKETTKKAQCKYDEKKDIYITPGGEILKNVGSTFSKNRGERLTIYKGKVDGKLRVIYALPEDKLLNRIKDKLKTPEGKKMMKLRSQTVEPSFGDIKENRKFRRFSMRGLEGARTEFKLTCLSSNFVKINNLIHKPPT